MKDAAAAAELIKKLVVGSQLLLALPLLFGGVVLVDDWPEMGDGDWLPLLLDV